MFHDPVKSYIAASGVPACMAGTGAYLLHEITGSPHPARTGLVIAAVTLPAAATWAWKRRRELARDAQAINTPSHSYDTEPEADA